MRTIDKRLIPLLCAALFAALASGAKPALVSETEAEKAGLELINLVYGAEETAAAVSLAEHKGAIYVDGDGQSSDTAASVYVYQVAVTDEKTNSCLYTASVNAKTGVAYKASRSFSSIPDMTEEQRRLADSAGTMDGASGYDYSMVATHCYKAAREWIEKTLQPNQPILGFIDRGFISDTESFPEVSMGFYAVMRDGTIYNIDMVWPQMRIYNFEILNQIELNEDDA